MQHSFKSIVASDQAVISNSAPYFKYHQSNKPRSRIPRRVMMALGQNQKQDIVRFFQSYISSMMHDTL
jgi:phage gpG-like protein